MVEFKIAKCPRCGRVAEIILSNNPLGLGLCEKCITETIDASDIKQADFFCRTYNIPFDPNKWLDLYGKVKDKVFREYTKQFFDLNNNTLYYQPATHDWWTELNDEWSSCRTFAELLNKVAPVKQKFLERNAIKWGPNYSFEDYVQLESLLVTTLRSHDITNPMQIDAIKKACKISVELDHAIQSGDIKNVKELSSAYNTFIKNAQIDEIITEANNDVISTVADLGDYIEKCGGEFTYYDNVDRDIVDKTIHDFKEYVNELVGGATGLTAQLETMRAEFKRSIEQQASDKAASDVSIEDLIKERQNQNAAFDEELEGEDIDFEEDDDDDDGNF